MCYLQLYMRALCSRRLGYFASLLSLPPFAALKTLNLKGNLTCLSNMSWNLISATASLFAINFITSAAYSVHLWPHWRSIQNLNLPIYQAKQSRQPVGVVPHLGTRAPLTTLETIRHPASATPHICHDPTTSAFIEHRVVLRTEYIHDALGKTTPSVLRSSHTTRSLAYRVYPYDTASHIRYDRQQLRVARPLCNFCHFDLVLKNFRKRKEKKYQPFFHFRDLLYSAV